MCSCGHAKFIFAGFRSGKCRPHRHHHDECIHVERMGINWSDQCWSIFLWSDSNNVTLIYCYCCMRCRDLWWLLWLADSWGGLCISLFPSDVNFPILTHHLHTHSWLIEFSGLKTHRPTIHPVAKMIVIYLISNYVLRNWIKLHNPRSQFV